MALPMSDAETKETEAREAIIRAELAALTAENAENDSYRDYYDGNQTLVYGTTKFKERFGDSFEGFRDNWCQVVVDAVADRLEVIGLRVGRSPEDIEAWGDVGKYLWEKMLNVDIDDKQPLLHSGVLIEGRSTLIIWPDDELGFTLSWNPAQIVRVRYSDEDPDRVLWATKRWETPDGDVYVTFYTRTAVYKYIETKGLGPTQQTNKSGNALNAVPNAGASFALTPRVVADEPWPLPNPFGEVPVVEFPNRTGVSELVNVVPQQDAINYTLMQMMTTGEFHSFPQKAITTKQAAPADGWSNDPGKIWHLEPMVDPDGKMYMPQFHQFETSDPSSYIKVIEMFLQHMAMTTQTPMRMFMQDSRGGRGDSPSGESLKVEDKPLLNKTRKRAAVLGNRWYRIVRLCYKALLEIPAMKLELQEWIPDKSGMILPFGEVIWRDDKTEYRAAAIAEAKALIDLGMPRKFAWKQAGFSPEEIKEAEELLEEQEREELEKQKAQMEMGAEVGAGEPNGGSSRSSDASGDGIVRPKPGRSGPRPTVQ